jgi:FkbM family methyltransferase
MNQSIVKKIFTILTGYWIHKQSTLPIGADLFYDIRNRLKYEQLNVLFDVGANIGQTFEWFRNRGQNGKLFCFEPVSSVFETLKIKTQGDQNCIVEHIAFGDSPGKKTIRLFDEFSVLNSLRDELMNKNQSALQEEIEISTVDLYCEEKKIKKIDFLKIDTEGYELNVIKGASAMIEKNAISFIYCEVGFHKTNERNTNFTVLADFLATKGFYFYSCYQTSDYDWQHGNVFANALFVHQSVYKK